MCSSGMDYCASADRLHVPGLDAPSKSKIRSESPKDFVKCLSISPETIQFSFLGAGTHFKNDLMNHFEVSDEDHLPHAKIRAVSIPLSNKSKIEVWYDTSDSTTKENYFSKGLKTPGTVKGRIVIASIGKNRRYQNLSDSDLGELKSIIKANLEHTGEDLNASRERVGNVESSEMMYKWLSS